MKTCNSCVQAKSLDEFYKESKMPDGYRKQCKACKNANLMKRREADKQSYNAYMRQYNKIHSQDEVFKKRERNKFLKLRYGLTIKQYDDILESQNGKCAICEKSPKLGRYLAVDHCHSAGHVRGLLCDSCNRSIAILDNEILLKKALEYKNKKAS